MEKKAQAVNLSTLNVYEVSHNQCKPKTFSCFLKISLCPLTIWNLVPFQVANINPSRVRKGHCLYGV